MNFILIGFIVYLVAAGADQVLPDGLRTSKRLRGAGVSREGPRRAAGGG